MPPWQRAVNGGLNPGLTPSREGSYGPAAAHLNSALGSANQGVAPSTSLSRLGAPTGRGVAGAPGVWPPNLLLRVPAPPGFTSSSTSYPGSNSGPGASGGFSVPGFPSPALFPAPPSRTPSAVLAAGGLSYGLDVPEPGSASLGGRTSHAGNEDCNPISPSALLRDFSIPGDAALSDFRLQAATAQAGDLAVVATAAPCASRAVQPGAQPLTAPEELAAAGAEFEDLLEELKGDTVSSDALCSAPSASASAPRALSCAGAAKALTLPANSAQLRDRAAFLMQDLARELSGEAGDGPDIDSSLRGQPDATAAAALQHSPSFAHLRSVQSLMAEPGYDCTATLSPSIVAVRIQRTF